MLMIGKNRDRRRLAYGLAGISLCLALTAAAPQSAFAQDVSWEYAPYDIRVWIAFGAAPELSNFVKASLPRQLVDESWSRVGSPWQLTITDAPHVMRDTLLTILEDLPSEQVAAADEKALKADKIMLVSIDFRHGRFEVACREFDCRTLVLSRIARRTNRDPSMLASTTLDAVLAAFSTLVQVETSKGKEALVRIRAGGLIVDEANPVAVHRNSLVQPVIRRNDRYGKPKRIDVIEWTYLRVDHQEGDLWQCEVQTALRNPLTGRGSSRTKKIGLGVKPEGTKTVLKLVTLEKLRREGKQVIIEIPMEGYEIFAKSPLPPDEDGKKPKPIPLGRTDWRGTIEIERDPDYPLRLIYVKNGRFLLARLPLIPGLDSHVTADLTSDDQRLEVEAFVRGVEATVMDFVARRQILASRIRRRLGEGKVSEARGLMEEFTRIPSKDTLERMIATRLNSVKSKDRREQKRIKGLLTGAQMLIRRYLDDGLEVQLREEFAQAGGKLPSSGKADAKKSAGEQPASQAKKSAPPENGGKG